MSVTQFEYWNAPDYGDEGFKAGVAECRVCGLDVLVCVEWHNEPLIVSTGSRPGCANKNCGEKFPCRLKRMATGEEYALTSVKWSWLHVTANISPGEAEEAFGEALMLAETPLQLSAGVDAGIQFFRLYTLGAEGAE